MTKVTIDHTMRDKLRNLSERVELCDEDGRVLGYFTPAADRSLYEGVDSPISEEELQRRLNEDGGRPLADILRDLEDGDRHTDSRRAEGR